MWLTVLQRGTARNGTGGTISWILLHSVLWQYTALSTLALTLEGGFILIFLGGHNVTHDGNFLTPITYGVRMHTICWAMLHSWLESSLHSLLAICRYIYMKALRNKSEKEKLEKRRKMGQTCADFSWWTFRSILVIFLLACYAWAVHGDVLILQRVHDAGWAVSFDVYQKL